MNPFTFSVGIRMRWGSYISGNLQPSSNAAGRTQEQHFPHPCGHSRPVLIPGFPAASPTQSSRARLCPGSSPWSRPQPPRRAPQRWALGLPGLRVPVQSPNGSSKTLSGTNTARSQRHSRDPDQDEAGIAGQQDTSSQQSPREQESISAISPC